MIKETKTVSVDEIMGDAKLEPKNKAKSSLNKTLNIEDIQQKEDNMKVKKHPVKSSKLQQKSV